MAKVHLTNNLLYILIKSTIEQVGITSTPIECQYIAGDGLNKFEYIAICARGIFHYKRNKDTHVITVKLNNIPGVSEVEWSSKEEFYFSPDEIKSLREIMCQNGHMNQKLVDDFGLFKHF